MLNLQAFAEGAAAAAATGADGANAPGMVAASDAGEESGQTRDYDAELDSLIKGEYKEAYNKRVSAIVKDRLKGSKETVDKYNKLSPTLEVLARKYGVDPTDVDALNRAIEDDDSYFEDEALERGISVAELKTIRKLERDNAELKREIADKENREKADRQVLEWTKQEEAAKAKYPMLNLQDEIRNPQFASLLKSGIDVETAFKVVHMNEIIPAAMQYSAKEVASKISGAREMNRARPTEAAANPTVPNSVKTDVSKLTREDRNRLYEEAKRGKHITF